MEHISTIRPSVVASPKKELFGPNRRNFYTTALRLVWTENILKTSFFENDDVTIITIFRCPRFTQIQMQIASYRCVFKFPRSSLDGKYSMCFKSETSGV